MATEQKTSAQVLSEEEEGTQTWTPREDELEDDNEEDETKWTEPKWTEWTPLFTPKTHDQQQLPDGLSEWTFVYCSEALTQDQEEYLSDQRWMAMETFVKDEHATQPQAIFLDGNYRLYCGWCYHADCEGGEPAGIMCFEVLCEWCAEDKD